MAITGKDMDAIIGDLNRFSALVGKIYEGALNPSIWQEVAVDLADWIGANKTFLHTPMNTRKEGLFITHGFQEQELELYHTRYQAIDLWRHGAAKMGFREGTVALGTELASQEELRASQLYKEFLVPHDMTQLVSGVVFDGRTPGTLVTALSLFRGNRQPRFEITDRERLGLVLPHFSRALGVMYRLREAELRIAVSLAALDRMASGVLLMAPTGEVSFANRTAMAVLETNDGLRIQKLHGRNAGRLLAANTTAQARLDAAIRQAVHGDVLDIPHFAKSIRVPRPSGRADFALQFSALPETNEFGQGIATPRAIVFINDPAAPLAIAPDLLINLYQLTPSEARLALALMDGEGLQEVAERLGISHNTAKTQLQAVYGKTGADNRARLAKLLVSLSNR